MRILLKAAVFCGAIFGSIIVLEACNEAICAPLVSKCMLIKCCECEMTDIKNCTCCKDCQICLSKLYTECCSCVGLCPLPDSNDDMGKSSSVEDLQDPIPDLFNVLTEEEDRQQRWTTFTYAVDLDKLVRQPGTKLSPMDLQIISVGKEDNTLKETPEKTPILGIQNCTVAFFSSCLPMPKCKASCKSMGASKYRWFHSHGCCECIGSTCFDYGLSEPK
ncbi:twisted gastrulation protein homolog 1-B-like isoform X2 [Physella acuta]|nr:twisted gastrulation protein homolog 1-B-like isoform X2 [Physella acuta]